MDVIALSTAALGDLQLKRTALVPSGLSHPEIRLVVADTDQDGRGEFIYFGALPVRWDIVEYYPVNCYELVQSDTGVWPTESIVTGNFTPYDAGDIDRDGKADLVGEIAYYDTLVGYRKVLCTIESRSPHSHPDSLNWVIPDSNSASGANRRYYSDLDGDSLIEILSPWPRSTVLFENVADDRESLVFRGPPWSPSPVGDPDGNGRGDVYGGWWGRMEYIYECSGDNQLEVVCSLSTGRVNAYHVFEGHDADNNGKPEFFVVYDIPGIGWRHVLYMFEAIAEHEYAFYAIDSFDTADPGDPGSVCADLDGDSIEEVVWSTRTPVWFLKSTGPHQFERVASWYSDHGPGYDLCLSNAADFNRNGYSEVYISGEGKTSVLEVEAVRIQHPDTGQEFVSGDTCWVRWDTFTPPRCDSVSLFLLTDTVVPEGEWFWNLDTIVTRLPPGDTVYPWVVPDTTLDAAWIVAIAYGPGWQFDRSDEPFSIIPSGVAERSHPVTPGPLPEPTIVGEILWLGQSGDRPPCGGTVPVLLDITGRKVVDLSPGPNDIRHLAPGVYFLREDSRGQGLSHPMAPARESQSAGPSVRKIVIQK